jgi:hypothetical protein
LLKHSLLVGPLLDGPLLVGPLLIGPLLIVPLLVGLLLVGPLLEGPELVGPLFVGTLMVGEGPLLVGFGGTMSFKFPENSANSGLLVGKYIESLPKPRHSAVDLGLAPLLIMRSRTGAMCLNYC